jgi:UDPglucose 6-dehydrogenase
LGASADLADATDTVNRAQPERLAALVEDKRPPNGVVGILGLAYKPDTPVIEESVGLHLASHLAKRDIPVVAYDPAVPPDAGALVEGAQLAGSLDECIAASDVLVLVTPWDEFRHLDPARLARPGRTRVLVDCWRVLSASRFEPFVEYVALGIGPMAADPGDGDPRR